MNILDDILQKELSVYDGKMSRWGNDLVLVYYGCVHYIPPPPPQVKHKRDIEVIFHPARLLVVGI